MSLPDNGALPGAARRDMAPDAARALAAVLVVAGHLAFCDAEALPRPYFFCDILNIVHMPLFCLLSGWFAAGLMDRPFAAVAQKAAVRLLIPYAVWSTVAVAAKVCMALLRGTFSWGASLRLWGETLGRSTSMWFFMALFLLWLMAWFLCRLARRSIWLALAAVIALSVMPLPGDAANEAVMRLHDLLPVFCAGLWARRREQRHGDVLPLLRSPWVLAVCCALLPVCPALSGLFLRLQGIRWRMPLEVLIELVMLAAVFLPVTRLLCRWRPAGEKTARLGVYSMDIYCIHMVFVEYIRFQMPQSVIGAHQAVSACAYLAEGVAVSVLSAAIAWLLRRFVPPYRWLMTGRWPTLRGSVRNN